MITWKTCCNTAAVLMLLWCSGNAYAQASHSGARKLPPAPASSEPNAVDVAAEARMPGSVRAEHTLMHKPTDRAARLQAARAHLLEGGDHASHVQAAQQHAKALLEANPNDIEALLLAAQSSLLSNDVAGAARYYKAATVADASNAAAFLGLGDVLNRLKDEPGATAAFARYRLLVGMPPLPTDEKK